jgi:hypothetical protein
MFSDEWMGDVLSGLAFQTPRGMTAGVDCQLPCTTAQESNAAPVTDAHKEIKV